MPRDLNQMTWLHLHPNKWDELALHSACTNPCSRIHSATVCETQLDMRAGDSEKRQKTNHFLRTSAGLISMASDRGAGGWGIEYSTRRDLFGLKKEAKNDHSRPKKEWQQPANDLDRKVAHNLYPLWAEMTSRALKIQLWYYKVLGGLHRCREISGTAAQYLG